MDVAIIGAGVIGFAIARQIAQEKGEVFVFEKNHATDETHTEYFCHSGKGSLPFAALEDLAPESAGIRPKLQGPGEDFRGFVITHEEKAGVPGLINLIGIESRGLLPHLPLPGTWAQ